jgi:hypothetical protein
VADQLTLDALLRYLEKLDPDGWHRLGEEVLAWRRWWDDERGKPPVMAPANAQAGTEAEVQVDALFQEACGFGVDVAIDAEDITWLTARADLDRVRRGEGLPTTQALRKAMELSTALDGLDAGYVGALAAAQALAGGLDADAYDYAIGPLRWLLSGDQQP